MSRVHILPKDVAEKIAAGEVIERPSSIVKELVENSLDAGATQIEVRLEDGGKERIEVIDNGSGIHPSDLKLCIQRHATSKLSKVEDLETLKSLGFRGEALPSIAACAYLNVISRNESETTAFEITVSDPAQIPNDPKPITFGHFHGDHHGTKIDVRSLFSHIPARLKFLKSSRAEVAAVREWIEKLALTRSDVGFRLVSRDQEVFSYEPEEHEQRLRRILANNEDSPLITETLDAPEVGAKLKLYWMQGVSLSQAKKLIQIVNGRVLKDRFLQNALMAPFRQFLLPGQFPAVLLDLNLDPQQVDVNVHPSKTEVRFAESGKLYHIVRALVERTLDRKGAPAVLPQSFSFQPQPTLQPRTQFGGFTPSSVAEETPKFDFQPKNESLPHFESVEVASEEKRSSFEIHHRLKDARFVGQLFKTYLIFELGEEFALVDQHAAHERVRYEALKKAVLRCGETPEQQNLLLPEAVNVTPELIPTLEERMPLLQKLGFDVEIFGREKALFRSVPAYWMQENLKPRLISLVDRVLELSESEIDSFDEELFEKLASNACHSAIRAGDSMGADQSYALVDQLFECEQPWNCPHGRPTVVISPQTRMEEWFQRKI